ncbi:MAG: DUF2341 domain-containing protein [Bacteroidota bacterium]
MFLPLLLLMGWSSQVYAQPTGFSDQLYFDGWQQAIGLTFDATGNMYVWEKAGRVYTVKDSVKSATPLFDISDEVYNAGDHGMVGFALDPNYITNGYIYLLYVVDRHHLLYAGTPTYNPTANEYGNATIGRLTRYTVNNPSNPDIAAVDYSSRNVLIGESISTGMPIIHSSHGVGSMVFGQDGTLLISMGDGASFIGLDNGGGDGNSWSVQALADGIIPPSQDVGAYRSQMLSSFNGKLLRIDPATGNGIPSNPFYDAANPRSPQSRTWALGLRNPCRISIRPGTGSHDPADADPGSVYIGDVGFNRDEELNVCNAPGMNFGWPLFEGMDLRGDYAAIDPGNQDAPTPGGCSKAYYDFGDLCLQWNGGADPTFSDPCSAGNIDPNTYNLFKHTKPVLRWRTGQVTASRNGVVYNVGGADVPGPAFNGNCSIGGAWYTGTDFPLEYQNSYFHGDYGNGWVRRIDFDANDEIQEVHDFLSGLGGNSVVVQGTSPVEGSLYYIQYNGGNSQIRKMYYGGNRPPVAIAEQSAKSSASNSLSVNFTGSNSYDPDGGTLTYAWDFGDGTFSTLPDPSHTFNGPVGTPVYFEVTMQVTDDDGVSRSQKMIVSLSNTAPEIVSTSLDAITRYVVTAPTNLNLSAVVNDAEHGAGQLTYEWQTVLYHDNHNHPEPIDNNASTTTMLEPLGCDPHAVYWYEITLIVTDQAQLSDTVVKRLDPDCVPEPVKDTASYIIGNSVIVSVLDNDFSGDAIDPATVQVDINPINGSVVVNPDGTITYTHNGTNTDYDSFTYTVEDVDGDVSPSALVALGAFPQPEVIVTSPTNNSSFFASDIGVTYTFDNTADQATSVRFTLDGGTPVVDNSLDGSFSLSGITLGAHTLVAEMLDVNGLPLPNPEASSTVNFTRLDIGTSFSDYMTIQINASEVEGSSNHIDFPVMLDLTYPELATIANGGEIESTNGYDIFFTDPSDNPLKFQIERYENTGRFVAWVNIPSLSPTINTEIRLHYGNAAVTEDPSSTATFNSCYKGRWHMEADPSLAGPQLEDATGNGKDATSLGAMSTSNRIEGIIGYGTEFDGANDYYSIGGGVNPGNSFTMAAWIKSNQDDAGFHGFFGGDPGVTNARAPSMWIYQNDRIHYGFGGGGAWNSTATPAGMGHISSNVNWHYVVTTYDGTNYTCFVDGENIHNITPANQPAGTAITTIGALQNFFKGQMDEVSVSDCVRSPDWIKTEYHNVINPSAFYTVEPGPAEISLLEPVDAGVYFSPTLTARYTRSGTQGNVASVRFTIDGSIIVTDNDLDGEQVLAGLSLGTHSLKVELMDGTNTPLPNPEATVEITFEIQSLAANYNFSKRITIQESEVIGTTPHVDFPVLIYHTDPDLRHSSNGGKVQDINGYDISFFSTEGIQLDHHIEGYDPVTGEVIMWVRIPSLDPLVNTEINILYGNSAVNSSLSTDATWKSCYQGRWHMDADPSGSGPQLVDVTSNTNDGTALGTMTSTNQVSSIIGNGTFFDGTDDAYDLGNNISPNSVFTLSAWISSDQLAGSGNFHGFLGNSPGGTGQRAPSLWVYGDALTPTYSGIHGGFGNGVNWSTSWATGGGYITNDGSTWNYVVSTFDGSDYKCYVDGILVFTKPGLSGNVPFNTPIKFIGRVDNNFRGRIDEVSVASCVNTAEWIQTEYNSQGSPSTFYTIGTEESFPVEWLDFKAEVVEGGVELKWTTLSEQNNQYFTVERSADGENFDAIEQLDGAGNSQEAQYYQSMDTEPLKDLSFYRIRQTDFDGQSSWSPVVEVLILEELTVRLYPNPVDKVLFLEWEGGTSESSVSLYNAQGQMIQVPVLEQATNLGWKQEMDVSKLPAGVYYLILNHQGQRKKVSVQVK